ncbi:hypothetical protein GWI33_011765, partial [Rhynchophorus ferrugineus]
FPWFSIILDDVNTHQRVVCGIIFLEETLREGL